MAQKLQQQPLQAEGQRRADAGMTGTRLLESAADDGWPQQHSPRAADRGLTCRVVCCWCSNPRAARPPVIGGATTLASVLSVHLAASHVVDTTHTFRPDRLVRKASGASE